MFSKYLKPGDLILAHDYAKDHETFEKSIKNNIWCSHEIELASIEESIQKYNKCFHYIP
jgi:hypothetical protein